MRPASSALLVLCLGAGLVIGSYGTYKIRQAFRFEKKPAEARTVDRLPCGPAKSAVLGAAATVTEPCVIHSPGDLVR